MAASTLQSRQCFTSTVMDNNKMSKASGIYMINFGADALIVARTFTVCGTAAISVI
jgi:hypothetical protein